MNKYTFIHTHAQVLLYVCVDIYVISSISNLYASPYILSISSILLILSILSIDQSNRAVTPIWLKATAGLRMLPEEKSEAILNSVRLYLTNTPFLFKPTFAKIIPGNNSSSIFLYITMS